MVNRSEYFLEFLPPVFAIYLVLISGLAGKFLVARIRPFIATHPKVDVKNSAPLIQNLVLSGATQVGILSSMSAAMISALAILRHGLYPAIFAPIIIFSIFVLLIYWIFAMDPDDLADKKFSRIPIRYSIACKVVLVVVNLILCLIIWLTTRQTA